MLSLKEAWCPWTHGQVGPRRLTLACGRAGVWTNMNIWHWTEWVFPSQSKGKLCEILVDVVVENARSIEGKCSRSCHKGKQIFFCQWNTKLGWKGTIKESGVKYKGQIEIAYFSEENEVDDTEVNLSQKKGDEDIVKNI